MGDSWGKMTRMYCILILVCVIITVVSLSFQMDWLKYKVMYY